MITCLILTSHWQCSLSPAIFQLKDICRDSPAEQTRGLFHPEPLKGKKKQQGHKARCAYWSSDKLKQVSVGCNIKWTFWQKGNIYYIHNGFCVSLELLRWCQSQSKQTVTVFGRCSLRRNYQDEGNITYSALDVWSHSRRWKLSGRRATRWRCKRIGSCVFPHSFPPKDSDGRIVLGGKKGEDISTFISLQWNVVQHKVQRCRRVHCRAVEPPFII